MFVPHSIGEDIAQTPHGSTFAMGTTPTVPTESTAILGTTMAIAIPLTGTTSAEITPTTLAHG